MSPTPGTLVNRSSFLHHRGECWISLSMARPAELCVYVASSQSDGITGRLISAAWDPWPFTDKMIADIARTDVLTLRRIVDHDRGLDWGGS